MTKPFTLHLGDCIEVMKTLPDNSVDSVVTDPPYGIRFMGKAWDGADIEARAADRRAMSSHAPDAGPNGGHKSIAAEAGKYDLAPSAMKAFQEFSEAWAREAFRVLKPGGHLLSFSSARTYHRMTSGIEDAGFEIRDQIMWVFGSGFPKSLDVSKAIDKAAGAEREVVGTAVYGDVHTQNSSASIGFGGSDPDADKRLITEPATEAARQWQGWGTALKPAHEPICVARKPLAKGMTVAANVLKYGTGALNIDGCRIEGIKDVPASPRRAAQGASYGDLSNDPGTGGGFDPNVGRYPANLIHDGSDEVVAAFPFDTKKATGEAKVSACGAGRSVSGSMSNSGMNVEGKVNIGVRDHGDTGSAARFFYCPKASRADRNSGLTDPGPQFKHGSTLRKVENTATTGNIHPTVKPTDLMAYLCRLVTPPGGTVLDPFLGSGSTGKAAMREGFQFIGIELEQQYMDIATARISHELMQVEDAKAAAIKAKAEADAQPLQLSLID